MTRVTILEVEDSATVYFRFPYNAETIAGFKQLPDGMRDQLKGHGWVAESKVWAFPSEARYVVEHIIDQTHPPRSIDWIECQVWEDLFK